MLPWQWTWTYASWSSRLRTKFPGINKSRISSYVIILQRYWGRGRNHQPLFHVDRQEAADSGISCNLNSLQEDRRKRAHWTPIVPAMLSRQCLKKCVSVFGAESEKIGLKIGATTATEVKHRKTETTNAERATLTPKSASSQCSFVDATFLRCCS